MKDGWKIVKAKDICKIQNGFAFDSKRFNTEKGKPLIRIRDVKRGFTETLYDGDYTEDYIINDGDLLIGMDGEFNMNYWSGGEAVLNQRVCKVEPNEKILKGYFFYIMQTYLKQIEEKTTFTTVKHLSSKTIQNIEFPLPPLSEQERIVSLLDSAFEKMEQTRKNIQKLVFDLDELKQSLLKKAFEGKL